jgi:hypothetical protein
VGDVEATIVEVGRKLPPLAPMLVGVIKPGRIALPPAKGVQIYHELQEHHPDRHPLF